MDHRNREKLVDVPERRSLAEPLECRENGDGTLVLTGYAATWEPYDCYGGPKRGGWVETISRSALDRTLSESPDVMLLINHEGLPIARTVSGNLALQTDDHGLLIRAELDKDDPDVQRIAPKMKSRGRNRPMLDEMSFSFRVKGQKWNTDYTDRVINELSLQKGDVSVVNYGMNPKTRAALVPEAVSALARSTDEELVELRRMDRTTVSAAMQVLNRAWRAAEEEPDSEPDDDGDEPRPGPGGKLHTKKPKKEDGRAGTWVNFDGSHLLHEGVCVTCANDRAKKPHGDVPYADPGYLGPDGKPAHDGNGVARYPIDETHVKAAWSYINMPKNQKGYTASQLASIKSKIKAAMKKFGHDVSDDKQLRTTCPGGDKCPGDSCPDHGKDSGMREFSHYETIRRLGGGVTLVAVMTDGTYTPLPSFRQSGELYGSPAGTDVYGGRARGTDNSIDKVPGIPTNVEGGPQLDYDWKPGNVTDDPHDEPYTKSDLGALDAGEMGKPIRAAQDEGDDEGENEEPDADDEGKGCKRGKVVTDEDKKPKDPESGATSPKVAQFRDDKKPTDDTDDEDDNEEQSCRKVDERLREIRAEAQLPDLPTVDEAMAYLRQLA